MKNVQDLLNAVRNGDFNGTGVTINICYNGSAPVEEVPVVPTTDFALGDRVLVCHVRHDGTLLHVQGTVTTVLGQDDDGYFTRVDGDNGNHYRTGLALNEVRKGSQIVAKI